MRSPAIHTLSLHDALPIFDAVMSKEVIQAIQSGSLGRIGLSVVYFSSADYGVMSVPVNWMVVQDQASATNFAKALVAARRPSADRKSTRLNSSHLGISYAVACDSHSFPTRRSSDLRCRHEQRSDSGDPVGLARTHRPLGRLFLECRLRRDERAGELDGRPGSGERDEFRQGACRGATAVGRSEEHTSELQSLRHLVCGRLRFTLFPYTTLFRSSMPS